MDCLMTAGNRFNKRWASNRHTAFAMLFLLLFWLPERSLAVQVPTFLPTSDQSFTLPQVGSNATWEETYRAEDRFPPPPRELARALTRGYEAYAAGEMVEAMGWLERVINRESAEDFLLRAPASTDQSTTAHVVSMSWAAHCLMCALPQQQRDLFQLKNGAAAKRELDQALLRRNSRQLTEIMRRYLYTESGQDAAILLGYEQFQQGRPGLAASIFRRLRMIPEAREKLDPSLGVMLALCCQMSNQKEEAAWLLQTTQLKPGQELQIANRLVRLPDNLDQPERWLEELGESHSPGTTSEQTNWLLAGGSENRFSPQGSGFPIPDVRWQVPLINQVLTESAVSTEIQSWESEGANLPLSPSPLVVNGSVILRSFDRIMAVDIKSGKRIWYYPAIDELGTMYPGLGTNTDAIPPDAGRVQSWLRRQAGADDLASDGQRLFFVEQTENNDRLGAGIWLNGNHAVASGANHLVALDVAKQGSLQWMVGGEDGGSEPRLANAFFLGPPLPLEDSVFGIVWLDSLVQLVQLDGNTGQLQWQQALATVDSVVRLDDGTQQSLSPSYSNGVLVCPTGLGVVVGIDLSARTLLWGINYPTVTNVRSITSRSANEPRWQGQAVQIINDQVLVTAQESDQIYCVHLLTGKSLWPSPNPRPSNRASGSSGRRRIRSGNTSETTAETLKGLPRGKDQLLVAANDQWAVTLGRQHLRAIRLEDGAVSWERNLDGRQQINGPGFYDNASIWLPNLGGQIVAYRIADGQPLGLIDMPWPIQTMICTDRDLLAVGTQRLGAFFQGPVAEDLFAQLDRQLDATQRASLPVELVIFRGQLLRFQKQWNAAIDLFADVWKRVPSAYHEKLLTDTLLEALAEGVYPVQPLMDQYGSLLEQSDPVTYLRHHVMGLLINDHPDALTGLLDMAQLPADSQTRDVWLPAEQSEVRISWRQWISWQVNELQKRWEQAGRSQQFEATIGQVIQSLTNNQQYQRLLNLAEVLGVSRLNFDQLLALASWAEQNQRMETAAWLLGSISVADQPRLEQWLKDRNWGVANTIAPSTTTPSLRQGERWASGFPDVDFQFDIRGMADSGTWRPVSVRSRTQSWQPRYETRWRPNDQLIEVYNRRGQLENTVVLNDLQLRRLDPRLPARRFDWGGLALHQFGNELVMMDWSRLRSPSDSPRLWGRDLANEQWALQPEPELGPIKSAVEYDATHQRYRRATGESFGAVSNILQDALLVHTGNRLQCLHPFSGELKWERNDFTGVRSIWQTQEAFYILADDGRCTILDSTNGHVMDQYIPDIGNENLTWVVGPNVIVKSAAGDHAVKAWNLVNRQWQWTVDAFEETPARKVQVHVRADRQQMLCFSSTGWVQILDTASGNLLLQQSVEETNLIDAELHYGSDCWLVVAKQRDMKNWHRAVEGVQCMPIPEGSELLDGRLFCFDQHPPAGSAPQRWKRSLKIECYCLLESELQSAPFALLASRVSATRQIRRAGDQCHLAILDLRNGTLVVEKTVPMAYRLGMSADPSTQSLHIAAGNYSGTLQWNADNELPPRPLANLKLPESVELKRSLTE